MMLVNDKEKVEELISLNKAMFEATIMLLESVTSVLKGLAEEDAK